jgi:hypothetical protein
LPTGSGANRKLKCVGNVPCKNWLYLGVFMKAKGNAKILDPKGLLDLQYTCPECGSHRFGSWQNEDGTLTRHCHGIRENRYCQFKFHEKEDSQYFHKKI